MRHIEQWFTLLADAIYYMKHSLLLQNNYSKVASKDAEKKFTEALAPLTKTLYLVFVVVFFAGFFVVMVGEVVREGCAGSKRCHAFISEYSLVPCVSKPLTLQKQWF